MATGGASSANEFDIDATGNITVNHAVTSDAGSGVGIDVNSSGSVSLNAAVTTTAGTATAGDISITAVNGVSSTVLGEVKTSAATNTDAGDISVNVTSAGNIDLAGKLTTASTSGSTDPGNAGSLTLTTSNGSVSFDGVDASGGNGATTGGDGGLVTITAGGANQTFLGGDIDTSGGIGSSSDDGAGRSVTFNSALVLDGSSSINTSAGGTDGSPAAGNIVFQAAVDDNAANAHTLTLTAGTGNIQFDGSVGSSAALGAVTIASATGVTIGDATSDTFAASSLTQTAGSGTTQIQSAMTLTGNLSLNTATIDLDNTVATQGGSVDLDATTAIDLAASGSITTTASADSGTASGAVDIDTSGTGIVNLAGSVVTTGADNSVAKASTGGQVDITTAGGAIAVNTITTDGGAGTSGQSGGDAGAVTLTASGAGNDVTLNGEIRSSGGTGTVTGSGSTVTIQAADTIFDGNGAGTNITATAASLTATSGAVATGADPLETSLSTLTASGATGLTITNTGNLTATLTASNGIARLINNTGTLTTGGAWSANEFDIDASGTLTVNDSITSDNGGATSGINLSSTTNIVLNDALLTTEGGTGGNVVLQAGTGLTGNALGTITTTASAAGTVSGAVDIDVTTGDVSLSGNIVTTGSANAGATAGDGGGVDIRATDGAVTIASIKTDGGAGTTGGNAAAITVAALDTTAGDAHNLTLNGALSAAGGTGTTAGTGSTVTLTADNNIVDGNASDPDITAATAILTAQTGEIDTSSVIETAVGTLTASGETGLSVSNTGNLTATLTSNNGVAKLNTTGTLTTGGSAWTANQFDIDATGNVTLTDGVTVDTAGVDIVSTAGSVSGSVNTTAVGSIANATLTVSGETGINLTNTGDVTATLTSDNGVAKLSVTGAMATGGASSANEFDIDTTGTLTVSNAMTTDVDGIDLRSSTSQVLLNGSNAKLTTAGTTNGDVVIRAATGVVGTGSSDVTTSGASGVNSGAIDIAVTGTGSIDLDGDLKASGASNAGGAGGGAGAITLATTSGLIRVDVLNASGGDGSTTGGDGAAVSISAGGGSQTFLGGNIDSSGGVGQNAGNDGAGQSLSFAGPVVLEAAATLDTSAGGTDNSPASGAISFLSTLDGAESLSLSAGAGDVLFSGAVGGATSLNSLTFETDNTGNVDFNGAVTVTNVALNNSGGTIDFNDNVTITSLSTASSPYSVSFLGASTQIVQDVAFLNNTTGTDLVLGNPAGGSTLTFDGRVTAQFATTLSGDLGTKGRSIDLGAVTLTRDSQIFSTAGTGTEAGSDITVSTIAGGGNKLSIDAGTTGEVQVSSTMDNLSELTLVNSANADFVGQVGQGTAGKLTINGTDGAVTFRNNVKFSEVVTAAGDYKVAFKGSSGSDTNAFISTVDFNHRGGLVLGETGDTTTFSQGVVYIAGDTEIGGTITSGAAVQFADVTLNANATIDTGAGSNITMAGIEGGASTLTLDAGATGAISVTGAVNNVSRIAITDSNGAVFSGEIGAVGAGDFLVTDMQPLSTLSFLGNTKLTDFTTSSATNYNIEFFGSRNTIADSVSKQSVDFTHTGQLRIGDGNLDESDFSFGISAAAAETVLAGTLSTQGEDLVFAALTIRDDRTGSLSTSGGDVTMTTVSGQNVTAGTEESLIIDAGTAVTQGNVQFTGNLVGSSGQFTNLTVLDAKRVIFGGSITLPGTLNVTSAEMDLNNNVSVDNGLTLTGNVYLKNDLTIATQAGDVKVIGDFQLGKDAIVGPPAETVADGVDVSITTLGGDFSVTGAIQGFDNATTSTAETLNINVADGNPATTTFDGDVSINTLRGDLGGTLGGLESLSSFTLNGAKSISIGDVNLIAGLELNSGGAISQVSGTSITLGGLLELDATTVNLAKLNVASGVDLNITNDATLGTAANTGIDLSGSVGGDLTVTADGNIGLSTGQNLQITGSSSFTATDDTVTLNALTATGSIVVNAKDLSLTNSLPVVLGATTVGNNAYIESTSGAISGTSAVQVTGQASLIADVAGGNISLTNATNSFGSLVVTSSVDAAAQVTIRELDDVELVTVNAQNFDINSGGNITGAAGSTVVVTGQSTFAASGDINLSQGTTTLSSLNITKASDVLIDNTTAIVLTDVTADSLDLTANGAITDAGTNVIKIGGLANFDSKTNNITLQNVDFGSIGVENGSAVVVTELNDIELAAIAASSFKLTAGGNISQATGTAVSIGNLFSLETTSPTGNIVLDGNNSLGSVELDGSNVEIVSSGAVNLQDINAKTLTVTATGAITQQASTSVNVLELATMTASGSGGNITLVDTNSSYGSVNLTGADVEFVASGAIEVAGINADTLDFGSSGAITGTGQISVSGLADFDSGGSAINLTNANSTIGTLSLAAGAVDLTMSGNVSLNQINVSSLDLTTGGAITSASGANVVVSGATNITSGSVGLTSGTINLSTLSLTSGSVDLNNSTALELAAVQVADLSLNVQGSITDTADPVVVTGASTLNSNGAEITFENVNFATLNLDNAGAVTIAETDDITLGSVQASSLAINTSGNVTQTSSSVLNIANLFNVNGSGIVLDGDNTFGSIQLVGSDVQILSAGDVALQNINTVTLTVNTTGDITQATGSVVDVDGLASFSTVNGNITLTDTSNNFGSVVLSGTNINLASASQLAIESARADQLIISAAGDIRGTGEIVVSETAFFDAGTNQVQLNDARSVIDNLSLTSSSANVLLAGNVTLDQVNTNSLVLTTTGQISSATSANINIGDIAVLSTSGDIAILDGTVDFNNLSVVEADSLDIQHDGDLTLNQINVSDMNLNIAGVLTDTLTDIVSVSGTTTIDASNNGIVLQNTALNVLNIVDATSVQITEIDDLTLGSIQASSLDINSSGDVTQTSNSVLNVANVFDVNSNGIVLDGENTYGSIQLVGTNVQILDAGTVALQDVDAVTLTVSATGDITQAPGSIVSVDGLASFTTVSGDITLTDTNSNFGSVALSGASVNVASASQLEIASAKADELNISAAGDIRGTGQIVVSGTALFDAGSNQVQLTDARSVINTLSLISSTSDILLSGNVTLDQVNTNRLVLTTSGQISSAVSANINVGDIAVLSTSGDISILDGNVDFNNLSVVEASSLDLQHDGDLTLNQINVADMNLTVAGILTDTLADKVSVAGTATIKASNNDIVLQNTALNVLNVAEAKSVRISETDDIRLGNIDVQTLTLDTAGDILQTSNSNLNISGSLSVDGDAITLDGENRFGSIKITGAEVRLESASDILFDAVNATNLTVNTTQNIAQNAGQLITVDGLASFQTLGGDINLLETGSRYGNLSLTAVDAEVRTSGSLKLDDTINVTNLTLKGDQGISGRGTISVTGNASLDAGINEINLLNATASIDTLSLAASVAEVTLQNDVSLKTIAIDDYLTLRVSGDINDVLGSSLVAGRSSLTASDDINLASGVQFSIVDLDASNVLIDSLQDIKLGAVTAGSLTLQSDGSIGQVSDSAIQVSSVNLGSAADISLQGSSNNIASLSVTDANSVQLSNSRDLELRTVTAENVAITNSGNVTDGGTVTVSGNFNVTATGSNIFLDQSEHSFGVLSLTGNDVRVKEVDSETVLGDFDVTSLQLATSGKVIGEGQISVDEDLLIDADDGLADVSLTNELNRLNLVSIEGGDVVLRNSLDTVLVDIDTASLRIDSVGSVTDSVDDDINVVGLTEILVGEGANITLGTNQNDPVDLGSVNLSGDRVQLTQVGDINVVGLAASSSLQVTSENGDVRSLPGSVITAVSDAEIIVDRNSRSIDLSQSQNAFGTISLVGSNVSISETDDTTLEGVSADIFSLISAGNILNTPRANVDVLIQADLSSAADIQLGGGVADEINFGRVSLEARNAQLVESSPTVFSGLNISDQLVVSAEESITQTEGSALNVSGLASLIVSGATQEIVFDGENNAFGSLDVIADNVTLNLAESTSLVNVEAEKFLLNARAGQVSIASQATFTVSRSAEILARQIVIEQGSFNQVGDLRLTTRAGGSIEIKSDILPRLISGNPTNPDGNILIVSPEVYLGADQGTIRIETVGSIDGGAVSIAGVDATGQADFTSGLVSLVGNVKIDTTNNGDAQGASVRIVEGGDVNGLIRALDQNLPTAFEVNAGVGDVLLGDFDSQNRMNNFTVTSATNVNLHNVYAAGNTLDIAATGAINIAGEIGDTVGDVKVQAGGDVSVSGPASSGQNLIVSSASGGVTTSSVSATGDVSVSSSGSLLLGDNVTASTGAVTLVSGADLKSEGVVTSGGSSKIYASGSVTLGGAGVRAVDSGDSVTITAGTGDLVISDVSSAGDTILFSVAGKVSQEKNTVLSAGGQAVVSAETGIEISRIQAANDVTLVVKQASVNPGEANPTFSRVNDPIPLGQGDTIQDVSSAAGAIIYLAPTANVGSAAVDQNLVQRSGVGVFYGLDQGSFFSDDIGSTSILNSIPTGAQSNLEVALASASTLSGSGDVPLDIVSPVVIDNVAFSLTLNSSFNATASAGETSAASSSRSTAASQGDEDEEVAEVDELVFQNLRNYDESPQGLRLPEDQTFAYDDDGNVYLIVTLRGSAPVAAEESFTLYKVDLKATASTPFELPMRIQQEPQMYGYRPEFLTMSSASGED